MNFPASFKAVTGNLPFPWQTALFEHFVKGDWEKCQTCTLPTGLGKTNVIAVWLLALGEKPEVIPRRLVYVVNRRTVVDQTTNVAEELQRKLLSPTGPELAALREKLGRLCKVEPGDSPLAISTLRGQFADNRAWSADPSRPAVICGTVDMIGSRLLFSGYGVGFKSKPLHAGFLGQDALIVHDEAHLEPAFQMLIETIETEQKRCNEFAKMRFIELTATTRGGNDERKTSFTLTADDRKHPLVQQRIGATKQLHLTPVDDDKHVANEIARLAAQHKDADAAVLVYVRALDDVNKVCGKLADKRSGVGEDRVQQLTGTMRGLERDALAKHDPVFMRFLPPSSRNPEVKLAEGTIYLVCTSAGEVGIDISADHMVCDLSTFESMAQRLGRVNRYGERDDTRIDVVCPENFDEKDKLSPARQATLKLLHQLHGDASPKALSDLVVSLPDAERSCAFAPQPAILNATDILFDAWALTTVREQMPGRPAVEPYLHGIAQWQPPETHIAWREEVDVIGTVELLELYPPDDLLDDYPLLPHELLRDRSDRVFKQLESLAERHPEKPAWLIDARGSVSVVTLKKLADKQNKERIEGCTILLPPSAGGLNRGMLDGDSELADDVADRAVDAQGRVIRQRAWDHEEVRRHLRVLRTIDTRPDVDDAANDEETQKRYWRWYDLPLEGGRTSTRPVTWDCHVADVEAHARRILAGLSLPPEIADAILVAAKLHDHGKRRERFQITLGNTKYPKKLLAKSGRRGTRAPEPFRHEFASILDVQNDAALRKLSEEMRDLALHLIAAHHGRARPHFNPDEMCDPIAEAESLASETPRRFARLQRRYGRWGLAYLESLLRAADWAASAAPSAYDDEPEGSP